MSDSRCLTTSDGLDEALRRLADAPGYALDLETTGLNPFAAVNPDRIVGIALGRLDSADCDYYLSFRSGEGDNIPLERMADVANLIRGKHLANHNIGFDLRFLTCEGFDLPPSIDDSMCMAWLCNENELQFALKPLAAKYLGADQTAEKQALMAELKARKYRSTKASAKEEGDMSNLWRLPASIVAPYAIKDIDLVRRMLALYRPLLERWRLVELYQTRCRLRLACTRMELRGMPVDLEELERQQKMIQPMMAELVAEMREMSGNPDLNPNSPAQVKAWLGLDSTRAEILKERVETHGDARARMLLDYRSLQKANSSFFTPVKEQVGPDGRIHANIKTYRTVTQRLAMSDPNLQQVAKEGKRKYAAKKVFTPPPGWFVVEADLSQIEPRVAVHFSKDAEMIAAFRAGFDIHVRAAKQIFRVDKVDTTTDEGKMQKDAAKSLSLGTLYALGALKIAKKLKLRHEKLPDGTFEYHHDLVWKVDKETGELMQISCSENDAEFCTCAGKSFQNDYADTWPALKPFNKYVTQLTEQLGYVRSPLTGAVRRFPDRRWCYKALNALIQMTAGEILKLIILKMDEEFVGEDAPQLVLAVHDSTVCFVKHGPKAYEQVCRIKEIMETTVPLLVPTPSEVKIGTSYGNLGLFVPSESATVYA